MAIKEIPARILYTCDRCGCEVEYEKSGLPVGWGKFEFTQEDLDRKGYVVDGYARIMILCQSCCVSTFSFITSRGTGK